MMHTTDITSNNGDITNQNVQTTVNETHSKDNNSEQLISNDSEQSTLEGNAESHSNQTPITSVGWDFNNSNIGSMISAFYEGFNRTKGTLNEEREERTGKKLAFLLVVEACMC